MIKEVVIIGAGNVATHMAKAFQAIGVQVGFVYSQSLKSAQRLGEHLKTNYSVDLSELPSKADMYLIAVSDDAIHELSGRMKVSGLVAHTSGTLGIDVVSTFSESGVFYPLQSFSRDNPLQNKEFPICIEATNQDNLESLKELAEKLVGRNSVFELNSNQRKAVHLAAVFASNYSNHMYQIAEALLRREDLNLDILRPLIVETAEKIKRVNPTEAQTGPAVRGDVKVMKEHLKALENEPDYKRLYEMISDSIVKRK